VSVCKDIIEMWGSSQEGRMRDQAFVTFPSTQLAEHALGMTHGYMLKGKPMIVQFGRNPFAAKNPPAT
jgi:U11/U12 small nuclear ribonucleoprotein SNRNP65